MGRIIDITDKLSFDINPKLIIRGIEIEVCADAPTVLKLMAIMDTDNTGANEILKAYELLFDEDSRSKLDVLKLSFADLTLVIQSAMQLIQNTEDKQGEV